MPHRQFQSTAFALLSRLLVNGDDVALEVPHHACEVTQRGFHILRPLNCGAAIWRNSLRSSTPLKVFAESCEEADLKQLPRKVKEALQIRPREAYQQNCRYFRPSGEAVEDPTKWYAALREGELFLLEGGQFQWPPVHVGFRRDVGAGIALETLALRPPIFKVHGLLTNEEADKLVRFAKPKLGRKSGVWGGQGNARVPPRMSSDYRPEHNETPLVASLQARACALTRMPQPHLEAPQIVQYDEGGYYMAHDDAGRIENNKNDERFLKVRHYGYFSRMLTLFWYLNDVPAGGATNFPSADEDAPVKTMSKCYQGLFVNASKGSAVLWYNLDPSGWVNPKALHAACVVEGGEKYAMNFWIRNKPSSTLPAEWDPDHPRMKAMLSGKHPRPRDSEEL